MDFNCNCFGVATAAKVPVKRYNFLVPDIFPVVEPDFHKPLSNSVERKIKKLSEYLERNQHRAPKVSRRLARRLYRDLRSGRYGYVKLAVQAYTYLLKASKPELSNLFATEIVVKSAAKRNRDYLCRKVTPDHAGEGALGSVVGVLLLHPSVEMRLLGVGILTDFIKLQTSSDYVSQLEGFVPLLCADANPKVPFRGAPRTLPEDLNTLQAACLRALLEHLRYCAKLAYVSHHLDTATYCVLDNIDHAGAVRGQTLLETANQARQALARGASPSGLSKTSVGLAVGASTPQVAALLVFEEISHITRDAAEGKKVLEFLMRYLDGGGGRWLGGPVLEAGMGIMRQACAEEHQRYLLFSSLMRHVAAPDLTSEQRVAVLEQAVQDGLQLESALAAPALMLALKELPQIMGGPQQAQQQQPGADPGAAADSHTVTTFAAAGANGASRQQELELARRQPAEGLAPTMAADAAAGAVRAAVLGSVRQLAACVGESGPLMEVVASSVSRLAGPRDPSTAALECCIAAAEAIQSMPEEARVLAGHTFPQLLLQELMMVMVTWNVPQRLLAHRLLLLLLPTAGDGLKDWQARALLSTVWHEAPLQPNPPAIFAALDACFAAFINASPAAALGEACQLAASLQLEVAAGGGRLADVPAAVCCALLCLCKSMLQQLAATLGHPQLNACAVAGCEEVLTSLALTPSGLQLVQSNGVSSKHISLGGAEATPSSALLHAAAAGTPSSIMAITVAGGVDFTLADEQSAEAFLQLWRAGTSAEQKLERCRDALAGAPLLRQPGAKGLGAGFQPLPVAFLAPRMKAGGMFGSGASSHGGSSSQLESKWVARVRELYARMPTMRDATADLKDMLPGASPSTAPAAGSPAALSQQYLDAVREPPLVGKSVDDVLGEIDSALMAMEQQVAGGRSPEHVAMLSLP